MMHMSAAEVRQAERDAQKDRLRLAQAYLQIDEAKAPSATDLMEMRRIKAAAEQASPALDAMLVMPRASELLACGAIYLSKPSLDLPGNHKTR